MKAVWYFETLVTTANRHYVIIQKVVIFIISLPRLNLTISIKKIIIVDILDVCNREYEYCIFWDVTTCSFVEVYQCFVGSCCVSNLT